MNHMLGIQGDSGDPYEIEIGREHGKIVMRCSCPAGQKRQMCKHRLRLLKKDFTGLDPEWFPHGKVDMDQAVLGLLEEPSLQAELETYENAVAEIKREEDVLKKQRRALSGRFARLLEEGI